MVVIARQCPVAAPCPAAAGKCCVDSIAGDNHARADIATVQIGSACLRQDVIAPDIGVLYRVDVDRHTEAVAGDDVRVGYVAEVERAAVVRRE